MARPTECTPEIIEAVEKMINKDILTVEKFCDLLEISDTTFNTWKRRGETGEEPYLGFLIAVKKGEAEREKRWTKRIEECGNDRITTDKDGNDKIVKGDWQAIAWLLERRHRKDFGRFVTKVKFSKPDQNKSEIDQITELSADILSKLSEGEYSTEEATALMNILEQRRKMIETSILSKQVANLEQQINNVVK